MNPLNPLRFNLSPEKLIQTMDLLFNFLTIKLTKTPILQKHFFDKTVDVIIQKLKSKHLVFSISFSDERFRIHFAESLGHVRGLI